MTWHAWAITLGFTIEDGPRGRTLVVTGEFSDAAASRLASGEIDGLVLNYARGFRSRTGLDFLNDWPLRSLNILDHAVSDLTPVYRLRNTLESLTVQSADVARIDLAWLPRLTSSSAPWSLVQETLPALPQLRDLFLLGYRARDLTALRANVGLTSVRVKHYPAIASLDGFSTLPLLERLGIYGSSRPLTYRTWRLWDLSRGCENLSYRHAGVSPKSTPCGAFGASRSSILPTVGISRLSRLLPS